MLSKETPFKSKGLTSAALFSVPISFGAETLKFKAAFSSWLISIGAKNIPPPMTNATSVSASKNVGNNVKAIEIPTKTPINASIPPRSDFCVNKSKTPNKTIKTKNRPSVNAAVKYFLEEAKTCRNKTANAPKKMPSNVFPNVNSTVSNSAREAKK